MSESRPQASAIRVLLVDDQALLRQSVRRVLEAYPNIEVIGEASDGEEALVAATQLQPTVVVMDISMAKMDGITATRLIKAQYPHMAVVGLSVEQKDYMLYSMQKVGASEIVHKDNAAATLYGAIQKAVAAVQPVLIMEEKPVSEQSLKVAEPSTKELMSNPLPMERPLTGQEEPS
jgi:DNA-binding NarL/FixJ family response regulator